MMKTLGKLIAVLLMAVLNNLVSADVAAYLHQDTFYEGDPITLTLENTMKAKESPNLSVLEKDFTVLGTSTSSQINIFNGRQSFKQTWAVELQPKHKGITEIPAITIGNETTQPLTIKIVALPPEVKEEASKHIFIETSVGINGNETYVQQQIPYMVKFYFDSSVKSGEISQPSVENAVVEKLTDDKRYRVMRGGKRYSVVEKHFTISPEKSGTLHIPPTHVKGRIALSGGGSKKLRRRMGETDFLNKFFGNDPFSDPFADDFLSGRRSRSLSQPFSIESKAVVVNVLPVPKSFTGSAWLPAEELNIIDGWTRSAPELKVGEPVTRRLVLRAKGLGGSQIPTIDVPKPEGIKIYPKQPTSETHTDGITLIGRQYFDISYIPQKEGVVTIPEIKVDWWNTKTKKQEAFTLPAWNLKVARGALGATDQTLAEETPIENNEKAPEASKIDVAAETALVVVDSKRWKMPVYALLLILALAGLFYFFKKYYRRSSQQGRTKRGRQNLNALKITALQACNDNDKQAASKAVIKLVQAQWNDKAIQNLGALALHLEEGVDVIKELEESLYSPNSDSWNGTKLKNTIEAGLQIKQKAVDNDNEALEPLYPF